MSPQRRPWRRSVRRGGVSWPRDDCHGSECWSGLLARRLRCRARVERSGLLASDRRGGLWRVCVLRTGQELPRPGRSWSRRLVCHGLVPAKHCRKQPRPGGCWTWSWAHTDLRRVARRVHRLRAFGGSRLVRPQAQAEALIRRRTAAELSRTGGPSSATPGQWLHERSLPSRSSVFGPAPGMTRPSCQLARLEDDARCARCVGRPQDVGHGRAAARHDVGARAGSMGAQRRAHAVVLPRRDTRPRPSADGMSVEAGLNSDFLDLLEAFCEERVEFLVVGAHALAVHGIPRATGDLDVWVRPSAENAERVMAALRVFGGPSLSTASQRRTSRVPGPCISSGFRLGASTCSPNAAESRSRRRGRATSGSPQGPGRRRDARAARPVAGVPMQAG